MSLARARRNQERGSTGKTVKRERLIPFDASRAKGHWDSSSPCCLSSSTVLPKLPTERPDSAQANSTNPPRLQRSRGLDNLRSITIGSGRGVAMKIRTALAVVGIASTAWMIAINVEPARAQPNQANGWPKMPDWPKIPEWPKSSDWPKDYNALATGVVPESSCRRVIEQGDGWSEVEAASDARQRCEAARDFGMKCDALAVKDGCVAVAASSSPCVAGLARGYNDTSAKNNAIDACHRQGGQWCRTRLESICSSRRPLRHR
jgi:hypothetical protein